MYDILIVGSGVVGLTQALLLAQDKMLRIGLVDSKVPEALWSEETYDARVYAITQSSQEILERIGVWPSIQGKRLSPFKRMRVWDSDGKGELCFDHAELRVPMLGHIIEESLLRTSLLEKLSQTPEIDFLCPLELTALQEKEDSIELCLDSKEPLRARLVIGADGGQSWIRAQGRFSLRERDYQHASLIAEVKTEKPHEETAQQVFLSSKAFTKGPLAFLPLEDPHTSSIVWSTTPLRSNDLRNMEEDAFCDLLTEVFEARLGKIKSVSKRQTFALKERHVDSYVKNRLALVGDAAHTLHPLAGQGVNLGLSDAKALAQVIFQALTKRRDFASYSNLRPYERFRKSENSLMLFTVKLLKSLFESENKSLIYFRNQGLTIINQMTWLKAFFSRSANHSLHS